MSQVDRDENGESDEQVLIEHLVVSDGLVVVVEDSDGCELGHGEQDHHTEAMEISAQACSTNPQAIHNCQQSF